MNAAYEIRRTASSWFISLLYHLLLLLGLLLFVFLLFTALPMDPARSILGMNAGESAVQALRHELGLDQPLHRQFLTYIAGLLEFDFGHSFVTRRPVTMELFPACLATLRYVTIALLFSQIISLLVCYVAYFHHRLSTLAWTLANVVTGLPNLVWALGLGLVILKCNLLIGITSIQWRYVVTAGLALSVYPVAGLSQILIAECRGIRTYKYVQAGRSMGLSERRLFFNRILPNALLPWLAQLANLSASLLAGSIFVEMIFSIPGLGRLVAQSVLRKDYPMIQGILIVCFFSFILLNFFVERVYRHFYPRAENKP